MVELYANTDKSSPDGYTVHSKNRRYTVRNNRSLLLLFRERSRHDLRAKYILRCLCIAYLLDKCCIVDHALSVRYAVHYFLDFGSCQSLACKPLLLHFYCHYLSYAPSAMSTCLTSAARILPVSSLSNTCTVNTLDHCTLASLLSHLQALHVVGKCARIFLLL